MNNIINNIKANLKTFFWPYRWLLGAFLLMFCVLSELHGSSIGLYADILGHPELNTVLLGKNRPIRSDEWLVFTPFAFSQYYTGFAYFGEIVRGTLTDMFLVYGQPVWDVAMLFRPAQWGYLFLDQGSGLAFFWMGRLIVLFLVSLEFGRILTKNKYLSIAYALMLSLSPLVQWWFSVNSLVEILAVGQGMVILFHKYLSTPRKKCRLLYLLGIMWCGGIYFFAIYPAWQVSFGYVFLGLLVWTGLENKSGLAFCRQDWWAWCLGLILLIIPISHVLLNSWQTIQIIRGTEYPGSRSVTGGNLALGYLWSYANSLFLPFRDLTGGSNNCEMASIFSLAPLGLVLSLWLVFKKKTKDSLFYVLIFLIIPLTVFAFRGFPLWLAKFTLLSNVTENRIRGAWEFIDLILLFRALPKFRKENLKFSHSFIMIAAVALMAVLVAISGRMAAPAYISWGKFLGEVLFAGFFFWAFVKFSYKRILGCVLVLMVLSGATVNPLAHGTKSIYQSSLGQKIAAIALQDKSLWLVEADGLIDFPIMLGAPTVNSVNIYPDLPRWEKLDQGSNKNIYNRYAHINVRLENKEPTQFSPGTGPDNFKICLNVQDLSKLQVHYLLTRRKLEELADAKIKFVRLTEDQGLYIYRAVY